MRHSSSVRCVDARIEALAARPLESVRHPMMSLLASRRAKWRAASRPSPMFAPVMRMVCPVKGVLGMGSVVKSWDFRKEVRKPAGLVRG